MFNMKFFVATVILATCLVAQAENIPKSSAVSLLDYYQNNGESRIISGDLAWPGWFPYQVGLELLMPDGPAQYCGGTLINNRWVLTAAHCVYKRNQYNVVLGSTHLFNYNPGKVIMTSFNAIIHPNYNPTNLNYDLALILLPSAVAFNDHIKPLRLPSRSEAALSLANMKVLVSGFGKTNDSDAGVADSLSYVTLDTITNDECKKTFSSQWVPDYDICCIGHPKHSTCQGDSGGPLVRVSDDGHLTHIGIVSFVSTAGCGVGSPSGFVRSGSFLDWINYHTGIPIRP